MLVIDALKHQPWPGNVRELQNVIERAVVAARNGVLDVREADAAMEARSSSTRTLAQVEREHILSTLHETDWVIGGWNGAAAKLNLSRTTLIARMQRLGISKDAFRIHGLERRPGINEPARRARWDSRPDPGSGSVDRLDQLPSRCETEVRPSSIQ
jgi:hypothetical protein